MISGELVFLRAMEPEDIDILYEWENNTAYWTVSNTSVPFSRHFLREFILRSSNDIVIDKQIRMIIVEKKHQQSIGTLDVFDYDPLNRRAGIGILVETSFRNKGYATEAVSLAISYCFEILHLHQIFCHVIEDNLQSLKIFKNNHFSVSGKKSDWILVNQEWKNVVFLQLIDNK